MFGLSVGTMGSLLAFAGEAGCSDRRRQARYASAKTGGTIRVGIAAFGASLEPYLLNEGGSLAFAGIPGEYLTFTNPQGQVVPALATSWKPNADATVWTFQIRKGVKFHNGSDDDGEGRRREHEAVRRRQGLERRPERRSSTPRASRRRATYTVVFKLKSPIGVFPYLLSQTTYQAIIQPASIAAKPGTWVKSGMIGTGAFKLTNYVDKKSATLVRNPSYWGGPAAARRRQDHVLPGQRADGARSPGRPDRPRDAAVAAGGAAVQEQLEVHVLRTADLGSSPGLHADRPGRAQGSPRSAGRRARRSIARSSWRRSCSGPVRSATTTRSGRASRRPIRRSSSAPRTSAREGAAGRGGGDEPQVQPHDVELPRPPGPRGVDPGVREARPGIDIGIEVMDVGKYYDSEPAGADYATTTPWLNRTVHADGVRRPWRAEHLPHPVLHVDR